MATEKTLKTRVVLKHDTEANWNKATTFIPKKGEVIKQTRFTLDFSHE